MDSPQLLSGPTCSFSLGFPQIVPELSPAFFINTLLNKAYCHCPNTRFCLYDLVAHADLLIKRSHLLCLLLSGQPIKIGICWHAFSFPISLLLTIFVSSLSNIGYPFPKRFFTGLNLFRSIKHILSAKRLKLTESFELSDLFYQLWRILTILSPLST